MCTHSVALGAWVGLTVLGLGRLVLAAPSIDMLYGEDGSTFVAEQLHHGLLRSLATPYQGYLHVAPRLLAAVAVQAPLAEAAIVTALLAAAVTAAIALTVFALARCWIPSPWARGLLALAMVLLPAAREEVVGNLANLQWPLLFAGTWALVGVDEGMVGWAATVVAVLAALSSPLSVLLAPVALVVLLTRSRGMASRRTNACFLGTAALQFVVVVTAGGSRTVGGGAVRDPVELVRGFGARAVFGVLGWPTSQGGPQLPGFLGAAVVVIALWYLVRRRGTTDVVVRRVALLIGYSVLLYLAPAIVSGVPSRYAYVPALLLVSAVLAACPLAGRTTVLVVGMVLVVWSASFTASPYRVSGPSWSAAVGHAQTQCAAGRSSIRVPIGPWRANGEPWGRTVFDCADVGT